MTEDETRAVEQVIRGLVMEQREILEENYLLRKKNSQLVEHLKLHRELKGMA